MKRLVVTGSSGLVGSEVVAAFSSRGWQVAGLDANMRADFFGPAGDTHWNQRRLQAANPAFRHHEIDVRDRAGVDALIAAIRPDAVVHCAAQPSHDLAARRPFDDFDINAVGTLNLLEACRRHVREAPFVHMSTNKVYGDAPNEITLRETTTRWDYADPAFANGIPETFRIDRSMHSVFGASKVAADVMVQEFGRTFGMATCTLRGGCLSGPNHSGVELHGFLSHLVRCNVEGRRYTVFGHKGKQVRDNIHSTDVADFIARFIAAPRPAEVYNIGGGRENAVSILEAFEIVAEVSGKAMRYEYVDRPRAGDHVCYYSDLRKMRRHFPDWRVTRTVRDIIEEIHVAWIGRG